MQCFSQQTMKEVIYRVCLDGNHMLVCLLETSDCIQSFYFIYLFIFLQFFQTSATIFRFMEGFFFTLCHLIYAMVPNQLCVALKSAGKSETCFRIIHHC